MNSLHLKFVVIWLCLISIITRNLGQQLNVVASDLDFIAFLSNPEVSTISILDNFTLNPTVWDTYIKQPIVLERNVSIIGNLQYPTLNLMYVPSKIQVLDNVFLSFKYLMLKRARSVLRDVGLDIIVNSTGGNLVYDNSAWYLYVTQNPNDTVAAFTLSPRPPGDLEAQELYVLPDTYCVTPTQCFKYSFHLEYFASMAHAVGESIAMNYNVYSRNSTVVCNTLLNMSSQLCQTMGLLSCLAVADEAAIKAEDSALAAADAPPEAVTSNTAKIAEGVGIGVGGAFLIALAAGLAYWAWRGRQYRKNSPELEFHTLGSPMTKGVASPFPQRMSIPDSVGDLVGLIRTRTELQARKRKLSEIGSLHGSSGELFSVLLSQKGPQGSMSLDFLDQSMSNSPQTCSSSVRDSTSFVQRPAVVLLSPTSPIREGVTMQTNREDLVIEQGPESVIGYGVSGCVVRGTYKGEPVAVKILNSTMSTKEERTMFLNEVDVLTRCDHPNVVKILCACECRPQLLIVEELASCSLDDLLYGTKGDNGNQLLPLHLVLKITHEIASALEYLHPTVIHRDLKPANVLLSSDGIAKISDFGLSRLTETGTLVTRNPTTGTVNYMAPELFEIDNEGQNCSCDIYSLGILMWEMLAGEKPWRDYNMMNVMHCVGEGRRPRLITDPERCPPRLAALISRCWDADKMRRPGAALVAKELLIIEMELRKEQGRHSRRS